MVGCEGALALVDTFSSGGSGPEYCAGLSTGQVGVTNVRDFATSYNTPLTPVQYESGTARIVPTTDDYLHFSNNSNIWTFPVPTNSTQGVARPHMIYEYESEVFIPDKVGWFWVQAYRLGISAMCRATTRFGDSARSMATLVIMSSMVKFNNPKAVDLAISVLEVCRLSLSLWCFLFIVF